MGDRVLLGESDRGVVVCSLDTNEYSEQLPREEWEYLGKGVLIKFDRLGLIHYTEPEPTLTLVARHGSSDSS